MLYFKYGTIYLNLMYQIKKYMNKILLGAARVLIKKLFLFLLKIVLAQFGMIFPFNLLSLLCLLELPLFDAPWIITSIGPLSREEIWDRANRHVDSIEFDNLTQARQSLEDLKQLEKDYPTVIDAEQVEDAKVEYFTRAMETLH
jgi:hypothetical protein